MITFSQYLSEMTHDAFGPLRAAFRSPFQKRGFTLITPAHAIDRAVEGERGLAVTQHHLSDALQSFLRACDRGNEIIEQVKQRARDTHRGIQINIRHAVDDTFINIPAVIAMDGSRTFTLTLKTIMVKRDFKPYVNDTMIEV